jgi:hypothetical protein
VLKADQGNACWKTSTKIYEQAMGENTDQKNGVKMGVEHARKGCFGVDVGKIIPTVSPHNFPVFQGYSTDCTEKEGLPEKTEWRGQDSSVLHLTSCCF